MTVTVPPMVSGGWPVIGHLVEMLRNREALFKRGYAEHGDLFAIKLGPQPVLVISGAEHNKVFYTETDKALNMQEGYAFLKASIGEVLFTASAEAYYNQRPLLQEIFKRERMTGYIEAMNAEVQGWLDSLGQSGELDVTKEMLRLTQYVAGRALIGQAFAQELGDEFWQEYAAISASLDPVLPPNLPLPKFKRRDRAKQKISATLKQVIETRRQHPGEYDDLITILLATPLKDGTFLPGRTDRHDFHGAAVRWSRDDRRASRVARRATAAKPGVSGVGTGGNSAECRLRRSGRRQRAAQT
ncbi:MAG: cytochrome P450 [Chloroflexi bacterium]|nr:cytochrome P450 [Chloroflexota bacterium]